MEKQSAEKNKTYHGKIMVYSTRKDLTRRERAIISNCQNKKKGIKKH